MREWRGNRKKSIAVAIDMPMELKSAIELSLTQLWSVATKVTFSDLENTKRESEEKVVSVSLERDEALEEIQRLESYIQTLENDSDNQKELVVQLEKNNKEIESNLINATKAKESQDTTLEDRKNQIAELNKSVKDLQSELIDLAKKIS